MQLPKFRDTQVQRFKMETFFLPFEITIYFPTGKVKAKGKIGN